MFRFKNSSIDKKLIFVVVILVFFALLFSGIYLSFKSYDTFDSLVETSSKEINKQIILNYESHFDEIRDLARYIEFETKELETNQLASYNDFYKSYTDSNRDVVSVSLVGLNGEIIVTSQTNYTAYPSLDERDWFTKAMSNESVYFFSTPHIQDLFIDQNEKIIAVSKEIEYQLNEVLQSGVLIIELSTEKIDTIAKQTNLGENGHLIIFSDSNELIFSSKTSCVSNTCLSNKLAEELIIGGDFVEVEGNDMYLSINTIHGTRWRIATFVNVDIVSSSKLEIVIMVISVFTITLIVSTFIVTLLTKQITKPLNELKEHMREISHSDHLYKEVEIKGQKEVVILSEAYNGMIKEIRNLMNQLVEEQNEKRKQELIALQLQINPHFLYNTLDSIVWLSEQKQNENVIEMVIALSRFFRISISRGKDVIPIEKEIDHAKYYLRIQKIRYSNKFDFEINVEEEVEKYSVVKLILQPIIENAINHGISTEFKGLIYINAFLKNNLINFEITNNGYGLTNAQILEIYSKIENDNHQSVGLKNVSRRLKLYYGEKAGIEITSILDKSTTFRLYFPVEKG